MQQRFLLVFLVLAALAFLVSCKEKPTDPVVQTVTTPVFTPSAGTYSTTQSVSITCSTEGATIRYTTDGTVPTATSTAYSNPITISTTTTINAKGFKDGWTPSATATALYTITVPTGFVYVPGGTFTMGDTRGVGESYELPTHSVTLNSFFIGQYEVTQAEYAAIIGSNPVYDHGVGDNYPVYYVSWYDVLKYCNLRSIAEGLTPVYSISGSTNPSNWGEVPTYYNTTWDAAVCNWNVNGYRLPTEAEWEYAARGATNTPDYLYSGSDAIDAVAWYDDHNFFSGAKPVGTKAPNRIGTYDMSGNLYEWCWDWFSSTYYSSSPASNPTGPANGSWRLFRGGDYCVEACYCRVAWRSQYYPYFTDYLVGFRLCRSIP